MTESNIQTFEQLTSVQRIQFVEVFIDGFGHLFNFKKDKDKFIKLLAVSFHPQYSYCYIIDDVVVGVMMLATNQLRPLKFNEEEAVKLFGKTRGTMMCRQTNAFFQSNVVENDTDLYIDEIAVSNTVRGQGIGTKLLQYAFSMKGFNAYYLEVLSKNTNAKRLYERLGFKVYKKGYFSPVRLLGYGYSIKMRKG